MYFLLCKRIHAICWNAPPIVLIRLMLQCVSAECTNVVCISWQFLCWIVTRKQPYLPICCVCEYKRNSSKNLIIETKCLQCRPIASNMVVVHAYSICTRIQNWHEYTMLHEKQYTMVYKDAQMSNICNCNCQSNWNRATLHSPPPHRDARNPPLRNQPRVLGVCTCAHLIYFSLPTCAAPLM